MKEVICDICGNKIKGKYSLINLPYKFGGYIMQNDDKDDAYDVCQKCASELYELIDKFKKDKKNDKTNHS